jgi:hypothetical protein
MTGSTAPQRGVLVLGLALVGLGGLALLAQAGGLTLGWPAWVIVPGVGLLIAAVVIGGPTGSGVAAVGGIVTMVGVVLAAQEAFDLYATWAYAWALVAPGGVGLGLTIYGLATGRRDDLRGGLGALGVGVVLFLVGFLFFEGVVGLSGGRFDDLTSVVVPLLLMGLGVVLLVGAFVPGPWRAPHAGASPGGPGAGTAAGAAAAQAAAGAAAAAGAGAAASGWDAGAPERLAIPLEGAAEAEVMVTFGAGHLAIGPAAPGLLVDGTYDGGVRVEPGGPGRIRLSPPAPTLRLDRAPYTWQVGLAADVPLRLRVEYGGADGELDLRALRVAELRLRTGASETRVTLPEAAGFTRVDAEGGAAAIRFRVPDGVAARIRTSIALGSTDVDVVRFPRTPGGNGWESLDFETAPNRVEIEVRGGVGSVSIR